MSWMKKRTPAASPALVPPGQILNPNQQPYGQQLNAQQWHQPQDVPQQPNWYNPNNQPPAAAAAAAYWQQAQAYERPNQNVNPTQYQNFNQYPNAYNQNQQPYQNRPPLNSYPSGTQYQANNPNAGQGQAETDPWNWGWDENNSNSYVPPPPNLRANQVVEDSFTNNDESWNWSVEEPSANVRLPNQTNAETATTTLLQNVDHQGRDGVGFQKITNNHRHYEELPQSSRTKSEKLPQQWSIESQVSQDSSDDIVQTSESDAHSRAVSQSQSSTVSQSPTLDVSPLNRSKLDNYEKDIAAKMINVSLKENQVENSEVLTSAHKEEYLNSPALVQNVGTVDKKQQQHPANFSVQPPNLPVNLETLPDNSEQPDSILTQQVMHQHVSQPQAVPFQSPENYEIAPINDRNQYLETGQLSDINTRQYNQTSTPVDGQDTLPPPGLRRMVLGQMEQIEENIPPPGLSRMVLGQTETSSMELRSESPRHMNRMVPGESSSPEESSSRRMRSFAYQEPRQINNDYVYDSEPSVPERSATIGADTPPTINTPNIEPRETNLDGANTLDESSDVIQANSENRRDSIDGEPQVTRDATVGENATDGANSAASNQDRSMGRISGRQESSDSERDADKELKVRKSPARYGKDSSRQYYDKKERSPDRNRDRKYDRKKYGDRNYEDDTDGYSEREQQQDRRYKNDRERREEDEAKKYRSLKRDKGKRRPKEGEREPPRHDRDYDRGERRRDYYYQQRYEDDYYRDPRDPQRSRPSSRSDSMHEYYRDPSHDNRERKHRDHHRRPRDNYNSYMQGLAYDPYNPYYQQYQYYENLRRTNPQAYAEMYRKYYQQGSTQGNAYSNDDRGSVHSGRSSANDEFTKSRINDSSLNFDETLQQSRSTPAKFATPHIKGTISSGRLVKVLPNYPLDGQVAAVEIINLQSQLINDSEYKELAEFPGPLVKGVTHKKTVIEYCENKIREAGSCQDIVDADAYVLMWELLILLLRQNGVVVGTDIAELLMKNAKKEPSRRPSVSSNNSLSMESSENREFLSSNATPSVKEEMVTNKFREYLIYGSEKEALEWAMKHGLWGHALFLASKLDKRTYANVMTRFANGLPLNDPLQTLYQLLSGRQPSVVTCVADEKWGDWKPHLAMILSNTSQRPELDRKAITTLGDTLAARGNLYSAQFCYLMAQVGFSRYGTPGAKLVLLGSSHNNPFTHFATNDAVHMSEIYEYACSLNDATYIIPEFQPYKYLLATRLADRGLLEKALAYLERVALAIIQEPSIVTPSLIERVYKLSDQLRHYDLISNSDEYEGTEDWIEKLRALQNNHVEYQSQHDGPHTANAALHQDLSTYPSEMLDAQTYSQESWQPTTYYQSGVAQQAEMQTDPALMMNVQQQQPEFVNHEDTSISNNYSEQNYWSNQTSWSESGGISEQQQVTPMEQPQSQDNSYWSADSQNQGAMQPQISMPNQSNSKMYDEPSASRSKPTDNGKKTNVAPKSIANKSDNAGWFGGLWNKLALRPKNQMKLPDDKNPTIVWDSEKNKWVNLEADHDDNTAALKPPPKMTDMFPNMQQQQQQQQQQMPTFDDSKIQSIPQQQLINNNVLPSMKEIVTNVPSNSAFEAQNAPNLNYAKPPTSNMFKMQRGRNIKQSYVDVFNPGGAKPTASVAPPMMGIDSFQSLPSQMNYFVPAPVTNSSASMDFLTPASHHTKEDENAQKN